MKISLRQTLYIALYLLKMKRKGIKRYPLVLMLEPLFQCNLACNGCGKIDYPPQTLRKRMSVDSALGAVLECNAPIVTIAGGEPLIYKELPELVKRMVDLKKFVYLCTNALLLEKRLSEFEPSAYLTWSIHLDGNKTQHDKLVNRCGVYDIATHAIQQAKQKGYRVNVNCTLYADEDPSEVALFFDTITAMGIDGITLSPGFQYEKAPKDDVFLSRKQSMQLFREIYKLEKRRKKRWPINHSGLFLDFLAGNQSYQCSPWSNPTYTLFGWQKPCYLLVDEGFAATFDQLMNETDWEKYGAGRNSKCDNCMAHCGYEGTAVNDMMSHPIKALRVAFNGPTTKGPMVCDV